MIMTSAGGTVEEKYIDLSLELTGPDKRLGAMGKVEKMISDDSSVSIWFTRWVALAFI